jgi:L-rhamnose-H+ transport protein
MELINGIVLHATGASSAALCYVPEKKVSGWSWQSYWLVQAFFCWLFIPVVVAFITIPELSKVLNEAPTSAMRSAFLLGMAYGIGGTAFGIAIRYVGFSLTYAIAVGISCVLGTLLPPLVNGTLSAVLQSVGANYLIMGMLLGVLGIAICGLAGRNKEKDISPLQQTSTGFSLVKGIPLCLLAGILSAMYGFSLDQGQPIADVAAKYGAGNFQGNVIYIFSNSGAFVTTLIYCLYLHFKQKTFSNFYNSNNPALLKNYLWAMLTGILWYGQFFFYGLGHVRMGTYKFSSWAIHMILLVLLSAIAGLILREWKQCSKKTMRLLWLALTVLVTAVLLLTYGNYIATEPQ